MRIQFPVMFVLAGLGVVVSAQGPVPKSDGQQEPAKQLFAVLDKKVATAERWVEIAEREQARFESMRGFVNRDAIAAAGGKVYEGRIALATARQQLYVARMQHRGEQQAAAKVVEAIEQKIAAARPRVARLKERLKTIEMLVDAGRAQTSELENARIELLRVELDLLEFSRELAEFRLTSGKK